MVRKPTDSSANGDVYALDAPRTNGERFYDTVIGSSTFATTFAASLASAYFFKFNPTGKKWLKPISNGLEKFFEKNPMIGGSNPADRAENVVEIGSLMAGGTVPVVPFKWIEENRIPIINYYNNAYGSGIDDPDVAAKAQARIDALPVQSWGSTLKGRAAAMGLTLAFGIPAITAKPIEQAQSWAATRMNQHVSIGKLIRPKDAEKAFTIDKYLVMDGTWSAFTSAILLAASRFSSKASDDKTHDVTPSAALDIQPLQAGKNISQISYEGKAQPLPTVNLGVKY